MKACIFYGSTTGKTEEVANSISGLLNCDIKNIADVQISDMEEYDLLILGTSTWGAGDLQGDWEEFLPALTDLKTVNKKIALFGTGDQYSYGDTFVDGIGHIYEKLKEQGAEIIGTWPVDGYDFSESTALTDGKFAGLVLDVDNQDNLTEERIKAWVEQIRDEFQG